MNIDKELRDLTISEREAFERIMENPNDRTLFWMTYKIQNHDLKRRLLLINIHESFVPKLMFGLSREVMTELFYNSRSVEVRREAFYFMRRDKQLLVDVLNNSDENWHIRFDALTSINDEEVLLNFVLKDDDPLLSKTAVAKISHEDNLLKIIQAPINPRIRVSALKRIRSDHSKLFSELVLKEDDYYLQEMFLNRIYDQQVLFHLACTLSDFSLCVVAISRIVDQTLLLTLRMVLNDQALVSFLKEHLNRIRRGIRW